MPGAPVPLVIDTDPGIDDAVTLALAARSPEVEVRAVTTTYGNAGLKETTRNARAVLALAGRADIAVHAGSERPLVGPLQIGSTMHGPSGIGYAAVLAAPAVRADPLALFRVLESADAPVTLVTLGPLTNLAHALARDEALVRGRVTRHVAMLGAFAERGAPDRMADFNAWADAEAAGQVLRAKLSTELVPLDMTRRVTLRAELVARLAGSGDALTAWLGAALRYSVEAHRVARGLDGCSVNDVLPLGEILAPGVLSFTERRIVLDLDDGEQRGHTREAADGGLVRVAIGVDVIRARSLLERVFRE